MSLLGVASVEGITAGELTVSQLLTAAEWVGVDPPEGIFRDYGSPWSRRDVSP